MALFTSNGVQSTAAVASQAISISAAAPYQSQIILAINTGGNGTGKSTCPNFVPLKGINFPTTTPNQSLFQDILWKTANNAEPTSYTVTPASSNYTSVQIWVFTGRYPAYFTSVTGTYIPKGTSPLSLPFNGGLSLPGDDVLWLCFNGNPAVSTTFTPPSGFTNGLTTSGSTTGFSTSMYGAVSANVAGGILGSPAGSSTWTGGSQSDTEGVVISIPEFSAYSKLYANGYIKGVFNENGAQANIIAKIYANGVTQFNTMSEISGSPIKLYANGHVVCNTFTEF
jgi:hypothetical protein